MENLSVEYQNEGKIAYFNGQRFTRDDSTGYYLGNCQMEGRRKRLHVAVWEYYNGAVPKEHSIHHYDEDKNNNEVSNLVCLSNQEHARFHYRHMSEQHRAKLKEANAWQYTPEGKEWHSNIMKNYWSTKPAKQYVCSHCGSVFSSKHDYKEGDKFCSRKCRNAHRYSGQENKKEGVNKC